MFSSLSSLLVAGLAMSAYAAPGSDLFKRAPACPMDNCQRAVVKTGQPAASTAAREAMCSSFLLTTISGCVATTTSTANPVTSTTTVTLTSGSTSTTTSTVTANVISTVRETSTTTTSLAFAKRVADSPVTGTVSQEPAACVPSTTSRDTAVPTQYSAGCTGATSLAAYSRVCSCALSTLSSRQTTTGASTTTAVVTPTAVAVVFSTTTTVMTETDFSTTTVSSTTTTTLVATATIQPVSGLFYVSTNEMSTISADASANNALKADMTNNAVYFKTDSMSKLMSGNTFAGLLAGGDLVSLSSTATDAEKISCRCANQAARTGAFTCRSSTGSTLLQLCAGNTLHLATTVVDGCRAIIAQCNPVAAT